MRWIVEVSSLGKTDLQKFCVEAESWQRALQAARVQRGEEGPMSGFSIELLEEGYRAVDPLARIRFVVKRAADDTPITAPPAKDAKAGVAPSPPSTISSTTTAAATAPAASTVGTSETKSAAAAPSSPSTTKSVPPRPGDKIANGPASQTRSTPPTSDAQPKSPAAKASADVPAAAAPAPKSVAPPASGPAPAPVGSALPGLPAVKVLSAREQNPTDASPLTYREYSFVVPPGTSEEVAVEVLRGQLKLVDAHLAGAKMGKLVNLAVFDVEFTGKPPAPVATLTWKDWKGAPVIGYPRRGAAQKQVKPPSSPPPAVAPAATFPSPSPVSSRPPAAPPTAAQPMAPAAPALQPPAPAVQPPVVQPTAPVQPPAAQPMTFAQPPVPAFAPQNPFPLTPSSIPPPAPFTAPTPQMPQAHLLPQQPASVPPPPPPGVFPSAPPPGFGVVPPAAHGSVPPPAYPSAPPAAHASAPPPAPSPLSPSQPPPNAFPAPTATFEPIAAPPPAIFEMPVTAGDSAPGARRGSSPDGMVRTPSGRFVRGRTTGDELITALFESMHDLHFLRDALDGGQFCLALATEVLPARAAIIHFFDVEKREWVVACTRGKDTSRLLTLRTPENDALLREAARVRRAVVTANAADATAQRYQSLGAARSMIIAPIMQAGRALGAIEIINPLDGMPFTDDEGNAMTYIAEQYAEYLGSRGIVLDRDRIQAAAR